MVKQREGYKVVISPKAKERIENDQCPSCGKPKSDWNRRKDWRCCSSKCTHKYVKEYVIYGWQELRAKALKRDDWKCVKCGFQPLKKVWPLGYWATRPEEAFKSNCKNRAFFRGFAYGELNGKKTLYANFVDTSKLIGDHIMPIACGGDEWDINNVQTLCLRCNKLKTAEDAGEIAQMRKIEKVLTKGQVKIWDIVELESKKQI
jgi:5-methylcytosine-specific restriction endonuclease McrA